jgi:hypothetical protein
LISPYSGWHCLGVREYVQRLNTMTSLRTYTLQGLVSLQKLNITTRTANLTEVFKAFWMIFANQWVL